MECKVAYRRLEKVGGSCINRNIVECKVQGNKCKQSEVFVLIET